MRRLKYWLWDEGWFFAGCMGLTFLLLFILVATP